MVEYDDLLLDTTILNNLLQKQFWNINDFKNYLYHLGYLNDTYKKDSPWSNSLNKINISITNADIDTFNSAQPNLAVNELNIKNKRMKLLKIQGVNLLSDTKDNILYGYFTGYKGYHISRITYFF